MTKRKVKITDEELTSLDIVLQYDWAEEQEDYELERSPEGHVFEHLQRVAKFVRRAKKAH